MFKKNNNAIDALESIANTYDNKQLCTMRLQQG
jgi:hypothetical protein